MDFTVNRERLRAFLADMDQWMREGDVVRRKTLLREVYQEIRIWPKTGAKPWRRKVFGGGEPGGAYTLLDGVPDGIRTRVSRLKIWGPRPA